MSSTPKMTRFEEIEESLTGLPITWYPALVIRIVRESIRAGVFQGDDGLLRFVEQVIAREKEDPDAIE